jgi:hypothetical protein
MKLKDTNDPHAICKSLYGPAFGGGHDMQVNGSVV